MPSKRSDEDKGGPMSEDDKTEDKEERKWGELVANFDTSVLLLYSKVIYQKFD